MFGKGKNPARELRRLVDLLTRYRSGTISIEKACRTAEAINAGMGARAAVLAAPPADLRAEDYRHMLFDVIARCRKGEIDNGTASSEAYLIRSILNLLRPAREEERVGVGAECCEEVF